MSNAAKKSIFVLIGVIFICLAYMGYLVMEGGKVKDSLATSEGKLKQANSKVKKKEAQLREVKGQFQKLQEQNAGLQQRVEAAQGEVEQIALQIAEISKERNKYQKRLENIRKERDELIAKLKERPTMMIVPKTGITTTQMVKERPRVEIVPPSLDDFENSENYWASVLRDKASLEVELDFLREEMSQSQVHVVEIRQNNADLKIQIDALRHDREELGREIKHKSDLINNLSLELARSKNDKKFFSDRVGKLNEENVGLRRQLKKLVQTKGALEKSLVKLTQDKNKIQKQLGQTEGLIQSKIDEIWEIKDSLDQSIQNAKLNRFDSNEIELSPIIVSSNKAEYDGFGLGKYQPGLNANVVSINEDNNFVIVDVGANTGLRLGDVLSVYRDEKYIARIEVIQVRQDISAADIKDQWSRIKVGDAVK